MAKKYEALNELGSLDRAARKVVNQCLCVRPTDKVTIICDLDGTRIAEAIAGHIEEAGAQAGIYRLEDHVERPCKEMPASLFYELKHSQMSIYLCSRIEEESDFRYQLLEATEVFNLRHAHLVHVTEQILIEGLAADIAKIRSLNKYMHQRLYKAKSIRVLCPNGTDMEVKISSREKYHLLDGEVQTPFWENLPSGEIAVAPTLVTGVFMCDGFPPGIYPIHDEAIRDNPLRIEIYRSRLKSIDGGPIGLASRIEKILRGGTNTHRIGGLIVGTNYRVENFSSENFILNMVAPGVTLSFGQFPSANPVMLKWKADADHPFSSRKTSLELDGEMVIENGKYRRGILQELGIV